MSEIQEIPGETERERERRRRKGMRVKLLINDSCRLSRKVLRL